MAAPTHVAHFSIARLRALPGAPEVAEFVDNAPRVNALAERSAGFIWRHDDSAQAVDGAETFQALDPDPLIAISLSVWDSIASLQHFVYQTVHGGFYRRREAWFHPWEGPELCAVAHRAGHDPHAG